MDVGVVFGIFHELLMLGFLNMLYYIDTYCEIIIIGFVTQTAKSVLLGRLSNKLHHSTTYYLLFLCGNLSNFFHELLLVGTSIHLDPVLH